MGIYEDIQNGQEQSKDMFQKALPTNINEVVEDIKKAKAAQIGEIRTWSGVKMRKEANGWVPVKDGSKGSGQAEEGKESDIQEPKSIEDAAREASETALTNATKMSGDPKVREAAHKELMRRKSEEAQETFKAPEEAEGGVKPEAGVEGKKEEEFDEQKYLDDKHDKTKEGKKEKENNIKEGLSKLTDENLKFVLEMNPDPKVQKVIKSELESRNKKEGKKPTEKKEEKKTIPGTLEDKKRIEDKKEDKEEKTPFEKKMEGFRKEMKELGEKITNYKTEKEFDDYMLQIKAVTAEMKAFVTKEMKAQGDKLVKEQEAKDSKKAEKKEEGNKDKMLNEYGVHKGYIELKNNGKFDRKPYELGDLTAVTTVKSKEAQSYIDSLPIHKMDDVPKVNPDMTEDNYVIETSDGTKYLVDTQGYDYPRHMTKLVAKF